MCGIAGIVRWGKQPIKEDVIGMLLVGNEHRGNDASGLVIQQSDGALAVLKKDVPGWKLIASNEYENFLKEHLREDSRSVLVHARGASQGNPRDNNNNHPMFAGCSALVHNGVIRNDDRLFTSLKLERKAETDSDILRAIVDKYGLTEEAMRQIGQATGSGAIAAVHPEFPNKLLLLRSGNPLVLASNEDFFYFSSEKTTLHKACRPYVKRMGMWFQAQKPDVDFSNMADNSGWIIGPKGLEAHVECRICLGSYTEPWRKTYEEYSTRQAKFDRKTEPVGKYHHIGGSKKPAWCFDCKKEWLIPANGVYSAFTCNAEKGGCGKNLWAPPSTPLICGTGRVN